MEKKMIYALVAVVVAIGVVAAGFVVLTSQPTPKYQIELWYNNDGHYGDTEDELATVLRDSIEACGRIEVTLRSDPWTVFITNWNNELMDVFLLGWYPDYFDSDNYLSPFLSTSGARALGSFYDNADIDAQIIEEQSTANPTTRADIFSEIQATLADDVPYLPLFSGNAHVAYASDVDNVVLHPVSFKWFIMSKPGATELTASTSDKITSLDPASAYDYMSIEIINQVFDTLLVYDPFEVELVPGLAREVPTVANGLVSADGTTYTYRLRPGITFSDGTPLTATIVKDSIERAIRLDLPGSAAFLLYDTAALGRDEANNGNPPVGAITVDSTDTEVTFHLQRPVSFFNDLMAFSISAPVHPSYSQTEEQPSTVGDVIGTGPYILTQHVENTLVVLERNVNYHTPDLYAATGIPTIPAIDQVTINIRLTATALKQDIETGTVDVVYRTLDPTDLIELDGREAELGITVDIGSSPFIRYLVFNVNRVPDVEVRQAIAFSVDRPRIDQIVFQGLVEPLYSMIPATMPYHEPVFQDRYGSTPDCSAANTLLAEIGLSIWLPGQRIARDI